MNWLAELQRRRVVPLAGVYLGACWVLLEFCNFVAERYHLSQGWVDALLVMAFALLPGMLLFAYNHGAPGRDRWTRGERVLLPLNLLLGLVAAALTFGDRPLSAMAETVERTDEQGQTVSSTVARQDLRRRLLLFPADPTPDDPQLRAAGFGLSEMLQTGLRSDPFVEADTVLDENGVLGRLRRAGVASGNGAPTPLQRRIASSLGYDYWVSGQLSRSSSHWRAELVLHAAAPGLHPTILPLQAEHLSELAEQGRAGIARALAEAIGAPPNAATAATPLSEQYGANDLALLAYAEATTASLVDNDQERAAELAARAIEIDPGFARAHLRVALVAFFSGQRDAGLAALGEALRHDYRLDDRTRFKLRATDYGLREQHEQRRQVLELWAELYPASAEARLTLATTLLWSGQDIDAAIVLYREVLQMLPAMSWIHSQLAELLYARGQTEAALEQARLHVAAEPESAGPLQTLARLQLETGQVEAARESTQRAALLQPELVNPPLLLAEIEARQGQVEAADALLVRALQTVREPRQRLEVLCRQANLLLLQARDRESLAAADQCDELGRQLLPPVSWAMDVKLPFSSLRTRLNGLQSTLQDVDASLAEFDQSFRDIGSYGRLLAAIEGQDLELARSEFERVSAALSAGNRTDLSFLISYARGRLAWLAGDAQRTIEMLADSRRLLARSVHSGKGAERFFEMQLQSACIALRAHLAGGSFAEAAPLLSEALQAWPGSPQVQTLAAELALAAGDPDQSRAALERAEALWSWADPEAVPEQRLAALRRALGEG